MRFLTIPALTLILTHCARHPEATPTPDTTPGFGLTELSDATYVSKCDITPDPAGMSHQESMTFKDNTFGHSETYFQGKTCAAEQILVTYNYKYSDTRHRAQSDLTDWDTYLYKVAAVTAIIHNAEKINEFNSHRYFDYTDWTLETERDISGRPYTTGSDLAPRKGRVGNITLRVDGDSLFVARYVRRLPTAENPKIFKRQ